MKKIYEPIGWEDFPSEKTPISSENLGKMDLAINEIDSRVVEHEHNKLSKEESDNRYANAIKRTYSGETIVATDSSQAKFEGLRVLGRSEQVSTNGYQLLDVSADGIVEFNTKTVIDNKIQMITDVAGTGAVYTYESFVIDKSAFGNATKVTLSYGKATIIGTAIASIRFRIMDLEGNNIESITLTTDNVNKKATLNLTENTKEVRVVIYSNAGGVCSKGDGVIYEDIMLNIGDTALPYEPYTGGQPSPSPEYPQPIESVGDDGSVDVGVYGKNLLPYPYYANYPQSANGATIDVQEDGGVVCSGTPTGYIGKTLYSGNVLLNGVITGCLLGTYANVIFDISVYDSDNNVLVTSSSYTHGFVTIDISEYPNAKQIKFIIKRKDDNKPMSGIAYPMIVAGDVVPTVYEKYKDVQNLQISTPNGLPGIPLGVTIPDAIVSSEKLMSGVYWDDKTQQYYIGNEKDHGRGKYVQRIGLKVFDGSETWYETQYSNVFLTVLNNNNLTTYYRYIKCINTHYAGRIYNDIDKQEDKTVNAFISSYGGTMRVKDSSISSVDEMKALVKSLYDNGTPMKCIYAYRNPIETDLSSEEIEAYKALTSNYLTNNYSE